MLQREEFLRAAILVNEICDSGSREHCRRIRLAQKVINLMQSVIAYEARKATSLSKNDPARMTWQQIGDALNLSKSAAFVRYGGKRDES